MSYLNQMPNAKPALQIVHVSDLHVVATKRPSAHTVRNFERWLKRAGLLSLWETLHDGTAPNDMFAPIMLREFIEKITVRDPVWSHLATWLVDTGDQTTYGDDPSFARARRELDSFVAACGSSPPSGSLINLYGNHDAWPDDLPVLARGKIAPHTAALAKPPHRFAVRSAQAPLRAPLPAANAEIQLYSLDTVNDGSWENFCARGIVDDAQLNHLDRLLHTGQATAGGPHLRILATHHPVHFPAKRPAYTKVIANESDVGRRLDVAPPFVHLVLSGHTHVLFPEHGKLPHSPRTCSHSPLGTDQCQLVVGTLMQVDRFQKRGDHPHQCQVLRFYQDPAKPDLVVLQRLLAARNPDAGRLEYDFIDVPGRSSTEEEMLVAL